MSQRWNSILPILVTSIAVPSTSLVAQPLTTESESAVTQLTSSPRSFSVIEEVIVTARKREETSMSVPVVMSAVGENEIKARGISDLDGIARVVPQLLIAPQGGSVQGGNISIRGIAGPDSNPFGDQTVSFNFDGVQVSKATVRKLSSMDVEQVEILKGPQALFFGKNSPAGIVIMRTKDPTPDFEAGMSVGYEHNAREIRTDGYVSAPLTDTLGVRVAGYFSDMDGYLKSNVPANAALKPFTDNRSPNQRDWAARVTLKWEPTDTFDARFKFNYNDLEDNGLGATTQYIFCPTGSPQSGAVDSCRKNKYSMNAGAGAELAAINPGFRDGKNYTDLTQILSSLEMNYRPNDKITITSVTGFYDSDLEAAQNFESDYAIALPSREIYDNTEISQEIRIQSGFDGPLNFSGGIYAATTSARSFSNTYVFPAEASGVDALVPFGLGFIPVGVPFQILQYDLKQKGKAYSAYAQLSYEPTDIIEITAGGRYSYEKKRLPRVQNQPVGAYDPFGWTPLSAADVVTALQGSKDSWDDFSPEVTFTVRPNEQLTLFASYKHGFLSGGFNSGSVDFDLARDLAYDPMTVEGFEGGVKALFFDNTLRVNLSAYIYEVEDMQVQYYENATNTIRNAAESDVKGAELDFNYLTPVQGLSINGAVAYNDAKYSSFRDVQCYNGQTAAMGCVFRPIAADPSVSAFQQDLTGHVLPRAPEWSLAAGFNFETPVGDALMLGLTGGVNYTSSYDADVTAHPYSRQPSYTLVDASVRVGDADGRWELALIGRNLTNKWYIAASNDVPFTGGEAGSGLLADRFATVSRGREVLLRLSMKIGQ